MSCSIPQSGNGQYFAGSMGSGHRAWNQGTADDPGWMRRDDRETIFKDGAWKITSMPGYDDFWDVVEHQCPWKKNWLLKTKPLSVHTMDNLTHCLHCGTEIPDSIVGLWKLKMMDKLQALHQSEAEWKESKFWGMGGFYAHGSKGHWVGKPGQTWEFYPSAGTDSPGITRTGTGGGTAH